MMGKDVERILSEIDTVKDASFKMINSLVGISCYNAMSDPIEVTTSSYTDPVISAMRSMKGDCTNMGSLKSNLYVGSGSFNNSSGSPWTELSNLQKAVDDVQSFASSHNPFMVLLGEKLSLMGLIQRVYSTAVDARWAICIYHDYVQRGYDHEFNGNIPSITFAGSSKGEPSTGNIPHEYEDNVHIPKPSIDPF